jgi:predicted dehydrogenase
MAGKKRAVVVGCGGMGKGWMRNVRENARTELAGVVDIRKEAAEAAAKEFGLPADRAFTDLGAAVDACKADFVCDITIPEAHCPTTVAALGRGLPVIGEKPLADSMDAARRMREASAKAGKLYMVSQSRRYEVNHVSYAEAIKAGLIGEVTTVNCDFYIGAHFGGFRDAMESPLILDMAIHHFDMCRFFVGADAKAVYAHEFNPKGSWYKGDVAASAIFELDRGIVFTYRGSWCAEGSHTSWNGNWRVIGTEGTLLFEQDQFPRGQRLKRGGKDGFHRELEDVPVARAEINGAGIAGSLNEFLDALERGKTPQCEVRDNIHSLAMVFAAMESSRQRQRVAVSV